MATNSLAIRPVRKKQREVSPASKDNLMADLKELAGREIQPLADEPDYVLSDSTLSRFLKARNYVVKDAFKQLRSAVEWRRSFKPLSVECLFCNNRPGYHGIRQIGFDLKNRPVLYACFQQCQTLKNTSEDIIQHVVYLVENGFHCEGNISKELVFILDCTGFTLSCCNPKIGKTFVQTFGDNYPEHLAKFLILNHSPVLHGVWKAIRVFIDPTTARKVRLIKKEKLNSVFASSFDAETAQWLKTEIALNKNSISVGQQRFWEGPGYSRASAVHHDPRGTPSYVKHYIEPLAQLRARNRSDLLSRSLLGSKTHLPHPNITQDLNGTLRKMPLIERKAGKNVPSKQELTDYGVDPSEPGSSAHSDDDDLSADSG